MIVEMSWPAGHPASNRSLPKKNWFAEWREKRRKKIEDQARAAAEMYRKSFKDLDALDKAAGGWSHDGQSFRQATHHPAKEGIEARQKELRTTLAGYAEKLGKTFEEVCKL